MEKRLGSGADHYGAADCVPAQSGSGEAFTGGGVVLPAPPHGELQTAVERQPGGRLLQRQTQSTSTISGSLCDSWSGQCYLLPVLDTVLVRRSWRRRGFGLQMLEDFCSSLSQEDVLGVSAPLSPGMVAVCRRFLQLHKEHGERLYEVEAPGGWAQRRNIWLNIQLHRYSSGKPTAGVFPGTNEERKAASGRIMRNEREESSWKIKACDPSEERSSPSSELSGTGCSPAAHAYDPNSGPLTGSPESPNTKQALKSKPTVPTASYKEKPEGTHGAAKRTRKT